LAAGAGAGARPAARAGGGARAPPGGRSRPRPARRCRPPLRAASRRARGARGGRGDGRRRHRVRDVRRPARLLPPRRRHDRAPLARRVRRRRGRPARHGSRGRPRRRVPADEHPARRARRPGAGPALSAARRPRRPRLPGGGRPTGRRRRPPRPLRGRAGGAVVRARARPPAAARPPQRGLRRRHGRDLPASAAPHRARSGGGARRPADAAGLGEGLGGGAQPRGGRRVTRVVVVGGGLAGVTAALECADRGASVTLLEARARLGGATFSVQKEGLWLDNGQHVFLRCCTAYRALLRRLGVEDDVVLQPRLDIPVLAPGGRRARLRRDGLPAPLHLARALARYRHLSASDRARLVPAALALRRLRLDDPALDGETFAAWLERRGQSRAAVDALWDLITLPTVNLPAREASLALATKVFQTGLLERADASDVGYARVPLQRLHGDAAERALRAAGATVRLKARASAIAAGTAGPTVTWAGGTLAADAVVLAVPHDDAAELLPEGALEPGV